MSLPLRQSLPPDTFGSLQDMNREPTDLDDVELVEISSTVDNSSSQSSDELLVLKIKFPEEPMPGLKDLIPDSDGRFWCNWKDCGCFFENEKGRSGASNLQRHLRIHIKPVRCPIATCRSDKRKAAWRRGIERHVKSTHKLWAKANGLMSCEFTCKPCKQDFARRDHLKRHNERFHPKTKNRSGIRKK
ncbi:hypothetical protein G7054_g11788 [Neopestalotiopsis clavispora]|nr:hypothetical protein G7054_g11788 [Neopestalotiopsis clavispora]